MKLRYFALVFLVLGTALMVLSYLNLYSLNAQFFDSGIVPIASNSSNEHGFLVGIGSDVKKVEVRIGNGPWGLNSMWGDCVWIKGPFQVSLLSGQIDSVGITTSKSPEIDYTFDVPSSWSSLGGIRISNPESQPVSVICDVVFLRQVLNPSWQIAMTMGLIVAVGGAILLLGDYIPILHAKRSVHNQA